MNRIAFWVSLAYILTIPGEVLVQDPVWGSASRMIGLLLAVAWLAAVVVNKRIRRPGLFYLAMLLFVLWNGLSIFWSRDPMRSAAHFGTWLQLFAASFILWDLYGNRTRVLAALQTYILGCYIVIGSAVADFLANRVYYPGRFSASNINPNDLGIVLAIGLPIAWYLANSREAVFGSLLQKFINYAFIPAALFVIAISGSRTGLLAAIPAAIFALASLTRMNRALIIAASLILGIGILFLYPLIPQTSLSRLGTTASELSEGDLNGRLSIWNQGLEAFRQHPFLGVGSDMYRSINIEEKVGHNSFLSVLVELGLVGIVLFGFILADIVFHASKLSGWDLGLWICVLAAWALSASTHTWEYKKATWLIFSMIVIQASLAVPSLRTSVARWKRGLVVQPTESTP